MLPKSYGFFSAVVVLLGIGIPISAKNLAYFRMYDVENIDGETPVMEFNNSEPHLSSDFQRIMANTHQICTNGIWRFYPGSLFLLTGNAFTKADFPFGEGFGSSTAYETCRIVAQWEALTLAKMGSLRRVGPENLDEISLRTYTGPYFSGIESIIDGQNMEDRNLRGYMDSYVITGPRNQHPDNGTAFIATFQFFQRERYSGEQTCLIMKNDQHGNPIPRKGAAYVSSSYEKNEVGPENALKFGSVKLMSYYEYFHGRMNCSITNTLFVPNEEEPEAGVGGIVSHKYGSTNSYPGHGTTKMGKYDYSYGSYPSDPTTYSHTTGYQPPSYEPTYQSSYGYAYEPPYQPQAYQAPSYEPTYDPSYYQPVYQPAYTPSSTSAYQPSTYNPPTYEPAAATSARY